MTMPVGIELSPVACRLVEIARESSRRSNALSTRVQSFAVLPLSSPETRAKLALLRGRRVAVVVWGLRSDHRQVVVDDAPFDRMRTEAIIAAREAGVELRGVLADIAPAAPRVAGAARRPVVLASAMASDVASLLRPLEDAGVRPRSIVTPAVALASLARMRGQVAEPDAIEAYVALEETATCMALVRSGALLAARETGWGYLDDRWPRNEIERRDAVAARLGDELATFFALSGAETGTVTQVCICGGMPDLRTMTVPLMERLDLEVETLDSLFAIDQARLPEPAEQFRERSAELRVAWAVAVDWPSPIDLLRERRRHARRTALVRAAVVAGITAGLGAGWGIGWSGSKRSTTLAPGRRIARATIPPTRPPVQTQTEAAPNPSPTRPRPMPMLTPSPPPLSSRHQQLSCRPRKHFDRPGCHRQLRSRNRRRRLY